MEREDGQQPQEDQELMNPPQMTEDQTTPNEIESPQTDLPVESESQPQTDVSAEAESQPQADMPVEPQEAEQQEAAEVSAPVMETPQPSAIAAEPRNFLVAFLILMSFGVFGLHQVYLGNKTQGWVRFGLGIASIPLTIILVGFLILAVLGVWAVVDFFMLYLGKRVDGDGQALIAGSRDSNWARALFITVLAFSSLYILGVIAAIALGAFANFQYEYGSPSRDYYLDSSYTQEYNSN